MPPGGAKGAVLERDAELARLLAAAESASSGRGALVVVEGPAGIGKTTLLRTARATAAKAGIQVLTARGGEFERDYAFGLVRQLFERTLLAAGEPEREALLAGPPRLAAIALGVPGASAAPGTGGAEVPGPDPDAVLHGLTRLVANLAAEAPILLELDDAHWADAASLRFAVRLADGLGELPVQLTVATRPDEPGAQAELLDELRASPRAQLVRLGELSPSAIAELTARGLGADAETAFVEECHRSTGGNPLLVDRLLRTLAAEHVAPTADGAQRLDDLAARSVPRSVLARLDGLPPACGALARAVAVLGDDTTLERAAATAELDGATAREAAGALAAVNVLDAATPLRFSHALVRSAVYAHIPRTDRIGLHARAARQLDADDVPVDLVAAQLLALDGRADPWVVDRLRAAARAALTRGAPDGAVRYLRRALDEPPHDDLRAALLAELGTAELRAGDAAAAVEHLERSAAETADPVAGAHIAVQRARALIAQDDVEGAITHVERAIDALGDRDRELSLRLEAEMSSLGFIDRSVAERTERRLAGFADIPGETVGECMLLCNLARAAHVSGASAARSAELAERALRGGRLFVGDASDSMSAAQATFALAMADDLDAATEAASRGEAFARETGRSFGIGAFALMRGLIAWRRGDLPAADAGLATSLELMTGWPYEAMGLGFLLVVRSQRGELEEAQRALDAADLPDPLPDVTTYARVLHGRGSLRAARGEDAAALEDLLEYGRRELEHSTNPSIPWRSQAALLHARLGNAEAAAALAADELALARRWGTASSIGIAQRTTALLQVGDARVAGLREAVATLERAPLRHELAHGLLELGAAERRAGQRRAAREALEHAVELARAAGARPLLERAEGELGAAEAAPKRLAFSGVEDLTASERRICDLAAAGLGNREIAAELSISAKTVENHLSRAYRKLDIGSRGELGAALDG